VCGGVLLHKCARGGVAEAMPWICHGVRECALANVVSSLYYILLNYRVFIVSALKSQLDWFHLNKQLILSKS